jgi:hypothetical protein
MSRLLLAVMLLATSATSATSVCASAESRAGALYRARQATLAARTEPDVFCGAAVDARTDIVAFPAGRSDRLYTYGYGVGRAYVLRGGKAQLVWCGKALYTKQGAAPWLIPSAPSGDACQSRWAA